MDEAEVAIQFARAKEAIQNLEELKEKGETAVLNYVVEQYDDAYKAICSLRETSSLTQQKLGLKQLENKLMSFGNTEIGL